jgi:hypothetical protein
MLTLANVMGHLNLAEDELEAPLPTINHTGKLYLSEEAWEEKWKLRDGRKPSNGGPGGRGGWRHSGRSNRGQGNSGNHDSNSSSSNGPMKLGRNQCRHCYKVGHWGRECPNRLKSETAHVTQHEEVLIMVTTAVASHSSPMATPASDEGGEAMVSRQIQGPVNLQAGAVGQR